MTQIAGRPQPFKGWVGGLIQDAEPGVVPLGAIAEGENFVARPAGLQTTRGGSRIVQTLRDDAGSPAELTHVCLLAPFTPIGALAVGWSDGRNRHYAYRLTPDLAFFSGAEATSRHDLTAAPSTSWNNGASPARPVGAELFEKFFLADATIDYASRNEFLSLDEAGVILRPTFSFDGGAAEALRPYCLEEYNGVLFLAGYGDGTAEDAPETLRHSFLARSPDAADGFDKDAYLLLGAKGQRVTALRKGRGLLLAAKDKDFFRITGFGRAYPGWQYTVENVSNSEGFGVANPHALCFAEGQWYGIGAQGPLRTDGYVVESLSGPRQRGWRAIDQASNAWVAHHPERRVILFGVHPSTASAGRSATYPWVVWVWDLERSVWQTDWKFGADFFMAAAVATSTAVGPTAAPSAPNTTAATTSGYTANWTNGDSAALTEVWEKDGAGGTWALVDTIAAGTATAARTGRTSHTQYYWKVRHRKNGITSAFTAETSAQTLIAAPALTLLARYSDEPPTYPLLGYDVILASADAGTVQVLEASLDGIGGWSVEADPFVSPHFVPCGLFWRAKSRDAAWTPTESGYGTVQSGPC